MKTERRKKQLSKPLTVLCVAVISLGFSTGSLLAVEVSDEDYKTLQKHKQKTAEQQLPAHQRPAPGHPSGSKSGSLAEAATNPMVPALITRTTIPYVSTPDLGPGVNRKHGFGDTVALGLFTPKLEAKGIQLGLGYTVTIPTAGDNDYTGKGKWQAGPSFLYINMRTPNLQWGLFTYQQWSFADAQNNREDVSVLSLQPFITLHLKDGWYIGSPDNPQNYNFKDDKWTWALGGQVGKVTKIGALPVKLFVEILNNPEDDAGPSYNWQAKLNMTMLFPE